MEKEATKLLNRNFVAACSANFLYFLGFYALLPIMALYLIEAFDADKLTVGITLACYTIAALLVRPFSGFLVDRFSRKPLYMLALFVFVACFAGYPLSGSLGLFIFFRVLHGLSFGTLTVSANTLVIDITPSSRRGAALGYYGVANNLAMATGPMIAVSLHEHFGYETVFYTALVSGIVAFFIGTTIKAPKKQPVENAPISLDRFILLKGIPMGMNLLLLGIPYGMITSYISLYSMELGMGSNTGLFYSLMAVGIVLSRLFSGKQTDRGRLTQVITIGAILAVVALFLLSFPGWDIELSDKLKSIFFNLSALLVGLGYGAIFPAMNALFVNLAPHNKRGTANSTYMTSWDIGIGIALLLGGKIGESADFSFVFMLGSAVAAVAVIIFVLYTKVHYERNRLNKDNPTH